MGVSVREGRLEEEQDMLTATEVGLKIRVYIFWS